MFTLAGLLIAGAYVAFREDPKPTPSRYLTTVSLLVPSRSPDAEIPATEDIPRVMFRGIGSMANSGEVRRAALIDAGMDPDDSSVSFSGDVDDKGGVTLQATADDQATAAAAIDGYMDAFIAARREIYVTDQDDQRSALETRLESLRARHKVVLRELNQNYPDAAEIVLYDENARDEAEREAAAPSLTNMSFEAATLVYERAALEESIANDQAEFAKLSVRSQAPNSFTEFVDISSPRPVGGTVPPSKSWMPVVAIFMGAVLAGVAAAVARDRLDRTVRSNREAAETLSAPVLATLPAAKQSRSEIVFLEHPRSPVGLAYRNLAATAIATDRLPSAIMVTSPRGASHWEVAANFAAALADLGVRVALVATQPDQGFLTRGFVEPAAGRTTFPELLRLAHSGRINGNTTSVLSRSEVEPNLLVLPPGDMDGEELPLDGLAPLLRNLEQAGVRTTVIAGPALLADADATIMAWTTRSVLWAVEVGELRKEDAIQAAESLQLAGVDPFGVAVVDRE